jgi:hypothetical protein
MHFQASSLTLDDSHKGKATFITHAMHLHSLTAANLLPLPAIILHVSIFTAKQARAGWARRPSSHMQCTPITY